MSNYSFDIESVERSAEPVTANTSPTDHEKAVLVDYRDWESFSLWDKVKIIGNEYSDLIEKGTNKKRGTYSKPNKVNSTGYRLGFYYADEMIYYAEVLDDSGRDTYIKLFYWGGNLIACRDYRADSSELMYPGDPIFDKVAIEFEDVYDIGLNS